MSTSTQLQDFNKKYSGKKISVKQTSPLSQGSWSEGFEVFVKELSETEWIDEVFGEDTIRVHGGEVSELDANECTCILALPREDESLDETFDSAYIIDNKGFVYSIEGSGGGNLVSKSLEEFLSLIKETTEE